MKIIIKYKFTEATSEKMEKFFTKLDKWRKTFKCFRKATIEIIMD